MNHDHKIRYAGGISTASGFLWVLWPATLLTATLGTLGMASGALAARVAEMQIVLIPVSIVSLVVAHCFAYRHGQRTTRQRALLWIATAISVGLSVAPLVR